MLVHGAEESKPLQCDVCYKRFLNNSALACHIKIHTGMLKVCWITLVYLALVGRVMINYVNIMFMELFSVCMHETEK
jgi:hypothetical protein